MPVDIPIRLVVFDLAGTTVDFGCFAPVDPFIQALARFGIHVTPSQARLPMGLPKKDHLRELFRLPAVVSQWRERYGRDWQEADVEAAYQTFLPLQMDAARRHNRLVPGLLDCLAELRRWGIRIGSTTGYFREAAEIVHEAARQQGYQADCQLCPDDVPAGRPAPWMIFRIMEQLAIYPPTVVVKVGDTPVDMLEGRNAGAWCVGVVDSSSEVGCTEEELAALPEPERRLRFDTARQRLRQAGAHAVIDTLTELPACLRTLG